MKKIKRLLAMLLSLVMAISCFSVVTPVFAAALENNFQNITFVDEVDEANKAKLNVKSEYADTELKLSGMDTDWLKATYGSQTNFMSTAGKEFVVEYGDGDALTSTDPNGYLSDLSIIKGTGGSDWIDNNNFANDGTTGAKLLSNVAGGLARLEMEGINYDLRLTFDLGSSVEMDTFLMFSHIRTTTALCTYKVSVSDTYEDLYNSENDVVLYDFLSGYSANMMFNGNPTPSVNTPTHLAEGQVFNFKGEEKPVGRYVGITVYDSAAMTAFFAFNEIGVFGTTKTAPGVVTYTGDTTPGEGANSWDAKIAKLDTKLGNGYNATLQMSGLSDVCPLSTKVAGETNQIKSAEIQTFAQRGTDTWTRFTDTQMTSIKDFGYINSNTATGFGGNQHLGSTGQDGYNKNTYAAAGDPSERTGIARKITDRYDAMITLDLGSVIEIDKFYHVGHPNPQYGMNQYAVYVGNDKETLYNSENEVFYFDYYNGAKNGEAYKFNGAIGGKDVATNKRTSEMQYLEFSGDKLPTGKYVGIKVFDSSSSGDANDIGALNIYELGVYGDVSAYYFDSNYASVDTKPISTSSKKVITAGTVDATVTVTDAEGNESGYLNIGDELTFKATCADKRYIFDGWYNGDQKVSSDAEYTFAWSGESLKAKYKTNLILRMEPAADITMKNYYNGLDSIELFPRDEVLAMGTWKYDADEEALYYTGLSAVGSDGKTYSTTGNAIMTQLDKGNDRLLDTEYEPWTTYKYSVTLKTEAPEQFKANQLVVGVAAHSMLSGNEHAIRHHYTTDGYVTYDFYFNSGAAVYENGQNVRENKFAGNGFNMSSLGEGVKVYLKELAVEKVSNVQLGETDGAVVTLANSQKFYRSVSTSTGTADASVYGGATKLVDIGNYLYDNLEDNSVIGAATDSVTFKVEPEDEFTEILSVKVNGNVVTADGEGNYTYSGAAIDDTLDLDKFVADGMTAYIIDVETEKTVTYPVHFADKKGEIFYTAQVVEGATLAGSEALATAEGMVPSVYGYHFTEWDNGTDIPITSEVTYQAEYAKNADNYTVVINYVDHPVRIRENLTFDARIELIDNDASYWTINGEIFAIGTNAVAYVAGNMEFTAVESYEDVAAGVTVVHDVAVANANDNTYATFARVINPEDKEIAEIGFIYITGGSFGLVGKDGFKMANLDANQIKYEHGVVPNVGTDFMVTYNGITNKQEVMRYARAYVKFQGDDTVYYSNVTSKVFNEGKVAEQ